MKLIASGSGVVIPSREKDRTVLGLTARFWKPTRKKGEIVMKSLILGTAVAVMLSGCATGSVSPMVVSDVASNRVYWEDFAGEGYRIKVTRDAGKMGSLCMTQLFIDGKLAAEIGQAESAVFKVALGTHTLKAAPSLATSVCKSFYSAPQFHLEVAVHGAPGEVKPYRYGFGAGGLPALVPSGQ